MVPGTTYLFVKKNMEKCLKHLLEIQELTDKYHVFYWCSQKNNPSVHDDGISGGGYPITLNSETEELVSLSTTINFIGCWMQAL